MAQTGLGSQGLGIEFSCCPRHVNKPQSPAPRAVRLVIASPVFGNNGAYLEFGHVTPWHHQDEEMQA